MNGLFASLAGLALLLVALGQAVIFPPLGVSIASATTYDLTADWSDTANPNGAWSYNNSNGPITIHQTTWSDAAWWAGQDVWALTPASVGHIVAWFKIDNDRTLTSPPYDLAIGDVNTHTWDSSNGAVGTVNLSSVTWTAPVAGFYDFSGTLWQGVHVGRSADAFVYVDGALFASVSLFDGDGYSRASPFAFGATGVAFAAGDKIELRCVTTSPLGTHVGVNLSVSSSPPGTVAGQVTADCPADGTPLHGVRIDAFALGSGALAGTGQTDASGSYFIENLPPGAYTITIVTPLGYMTSSPEIVVTVSGGQTAAADFACQCVSVTANPRAIGFWKHQIGVATGGRGAAQVDGTTLCAYLDLIDGHFNSNAVNEVAVYIPPASGFCSDKLLVAKSLLNLVGSQAMIARARQQLLALLLNVAAGFIGLNQVISADGATVSQAITYCDNLIDDPDRDHERAKTIAETINNGQPAAVGMIPLNTAQIAYRRGAEALSFRVTPNPGSAAREFHFVTGARGAVNLALYDVSGRLVSEIFRGDMDAGAHSVRWEGRVSSGGPAARGLYFARLQTPRESLTIKVLQLKRE